MQCLLPAGGRMVNAAVCFSVQVLLDRWGSFMTAPGGYKQVSGK